MISKRLVFLLLLSALSCVALSGVALADDSQPRHVQSGALLMLLKAPHPQIQGRALAKIGRDVPSLLVEFANSTDQPPQVRLRALAWLEWFPSVQTRAVLLETLSARNPDVHTIRVCLRALAFAFGAEMVPTESDYLENADVHVREAAAYALGDIADRRVREVLVAHLDRERELTVRDAIMTSLKRVAAREATQARPTRTSPETSESVKPRR